MMRPVAASLIAPMTSSLIQSVASSLINDLIEREVRRTEKKRQEDDFFHY